MILKIVIVSILTVLLSCIGLLHVYWLVGGEKWLDAALPNDYERAKQQFSVPVMRILKVITLAPVIIVLGVLVVSLYDIFLFIDPYKEQVYFWFSIIFISRGVLGWLVINKLTKKDLFIRNNTLIYSPISLSLGVLFMALYLL